MAPRKLASALQSLPPILHMRHECQCKAIVKVHGVFRLTAGPRIFTGNSISLSLCWMTAGSRYAIRAGRNLPDKEFRYLRTVIVTAAVYWGFNSKLAPLLLTFQHRQASDPIRRLIDFAEPCVFDKQSLPLVCATSLYLRTKRSRFFRSYACNLPSSST